MASAATITSLFALYGRHGASDYIGEKISSIAHALQSAAAATASGATAPVVAAALLHDVGHLLGLDEPLKHAGRMGHCGVVDHESVGAAHLAALGFPQLTVELVRRHVDAKRFLTATDPTYYATLSDASRTTLGYQGGPMSAEEVAAFELSPLRDTILAMRRWDEAAKEPGKSVPALESYRGLLGGLLEGGAA